MMTSKKHKRGENVRLITNGWYYGAEGTILKKSQTQTDEHNPYFDIDFKGQGPKGIRSVKWNWFESLSEEKQGI